MNDKLVVELDASFQEAIREAVLNEIKDRVAHHFMAEVKASVASRIQEEVAKVFEQESPRAMVRDALRESMPRVVDELCEGNAFVAQEVDIAKKCIRAKVFSRNMRAIFLPGFSDGAMAELAQAIAKLEVEPAGQQGGNGKKKEIPPERPDLDFKDAPIVMPRNPVPGQWG